jgi:hypothetical protein
MKKLSALSLLDQGSAKVYCMVGYSLAEAMKPLLTTNP